MSNVSSSKSLFLTLRTNYPKNNFFISLFYLFSTIFTFYFAQFFGAILFWLIASFFFSNESAFKIWSESNIAFFYLALSVHFFYIFFTLIWLKILRKKLDFIKISKRIAWKDVLYAVLGYIFYLSIYFVLYLFIERALQVIDTNQEQNIGFSPVSNVDMIFSYISLAIITPIAEEVIFRGYLFNGLRTRLTGIYSALITSCLFGAAHLGLFSAEKLNWIVAIDTFVLSMVLCTLVAKRNSLYPAIFLHSIKNTVAFVALFVIKG